MRRAILAVLAIVALGACSYETRETCIAVHIDSDAPERTFAEECEELTR